VKIFIDTPVYRIYRYWEEQYVKYKNASNIKVFNISIIGKIV